MAWERRTEKPLIVAAIVFLIAYAWPILDTGLSAWAATAFSVVTYVVWAMFALDYVVRLALADSRLRFVRANWIDLVILGVPMLRPLRPLRAVLALDLVARRSRLVRGKVVAFVGAAVAIVLFVAALAVLDVERRNPEATIESFGDALWWGATTVTTVGYGDQFPTTNEGRIVAVGLMLTGIALVGVVTGAVASWFVERVSGATASAEERIEQQVAEVMAELQALREEIRALRETSAVTSPRRGVTKWMTGRAEGSHAQPDPWIMETSLSWSPPVHGGSTTKYYVDGRCAGRIPEQSPSRRVFERGRWPG